MSVVLVAIGSIIEYTMMLANAEFILLIVGDLIVDVNQQYYYNHYAHPYVLLHRL